MEHLNDTLFTAANVDSMIARLRPRIERAAYLEGDLAQPSHTGRQFTNDQFARHGFQHDELRRGSTFILGIPHFVRIRHDNVAARLTRLRSSNAMPKDSSGASFPAAPGVAAVEASCCAKRVTALSTRDSNGSGTRESSADAASRRGASDAREASIWTGRYSAFRPTRLASGARPRLALRPAVEPRSRSSLALGDESPPACRGARDPGPAVQMTVAERATWGGPRAGSGAKAAARPNVRHRTRPLHKHWVPAHVTLRRSGGLPSFQAERLRRLLELAIRDTRRDGFRIVEYRVQADHVHLMIEAENNETLTTACAASPFVSPYA